MAPVKFIGMLVLAIDRFRSIVLKTRTHQKVMPKQGAHVVFFTL
jgi:hypothetical protein